MVGTTDVAKPALERVAGKRVGRRFGLPVRSVSIALVVGLFLSVLSGVSAYRAVGPYGDGPFGGGFRRIPADSAGRSILVHDSRTGTDIVRAVINEGTGRVVELRIAPGGDVARATHLYLDEGGGARVPLDDDGDGIPDRWEYYDDVRRIGSGVADRVGFSLAGDNVVDAWAFHDEQGQVSRVEVSTTRDGDVDRWEYYDGGALVRVETDTDRDGRVDSWSIYRNGVLSTTRSDTDGNGLPDPAEGAAAR